MRISLYFHTLRYLRPSQLFFRAYRWCKRPDFILPGELPAPRIMKGDWRVWNCQSARMVAKDEFVFLRTKGKLESSFDWNDIRQDKLWLYNLHYFDDLVAEAAESRNEWHREMIHRWVNENPVGLGVGWEPYTISLRVVNWIKWILNGNEPEQKWLDSLALQVHVLTQQLEYHLLGNHLFANAKALIFAGLFFEGKVAEKWLKKGLKILDREIPEQILEDGAHFELSPMYHCIILQDMLDLLNITDAYPHSGLRDRLDIWRSIASQMFFWMDNMLHPDGEIAFFNDAAFGVAPAAEKLKQYAFLLQINMKGLREYNEMVAPSLLDLGASGYIRVVSDDSVVIIDCADIGPNYIPGHAHADSLSFELSIGSQRVLVNSGISGYGLSDERHRQRSTAAHNTVVVDGLNSSEVWAGFRVARRARIVERKVLTKETGEVEICAMHNGFVKQGLKVFHRRTWSFGQRTLDVIDELNGDFHSAVGYLHLHPDIKIVSESNYKFVFKTPTHQITFEFAGTCAELINGIWHPEFGLDIPNHFIKLIFLQPKVQTSVCWQVLH
tara:strand:- start:118367 stop:120028 length:1662 start_codon:yes stop_codon:yes gene_type:complete